MNNLVNIINKLVLCGEGFAIINDRLYTVENGTAPTAQGTWHFSGKDFGLFEADTMSAYQDELIEQNKLTVEKQMSHILDTKLVSSLEDIGQQANEMFNYMRQQRKNSADVFFSKIMNQYCRTEDDDNIPEPVDISVHCTLTTDALKNKSSITKKIIPSGVLCVANAVYVIDENQNPNGHGHITVDEKTYGIQPFEEKGKQIPTTQLAKKYDAHIRGLIEAETLRQGSTIKDQIESVRESINVARQKQHETKKGSIGYEQIGEDNYLLYTKINPYIICVDDKYYAFNENGKQGSKIVEIGIEVAVHDSHVVLGSPPVVLNRPYAHPFVDYENGYICFADANRWSAQGLKFFPDRLNMSSADIPKKIAYILQEGVYNLTNGYTTTNLKPLTDISKFTPVAYSKQDAKRYADQHNIPHSRIIKNR